METLSFTIRPATADDAESLCELIHGLAEFEKLAHEARPNARVLADHLAPATSPRCHALIAENDAGEAIGFALFFQNYSTFLTDWGIYLEDLFVVPKFRRMGVGRALLRGVAHEAVSRGCLRLDLSVLDWNRGAIDFYDSLGAAALDDWTTMRFAGSHLKALADSATVS